MLRHGDLWHGNLLIDRGKLSGVVDWDAWRSDGVPGTDVLHLLGTAERRRRSMAFGTYWASRPWRTPSCRTPLCHLLELLDLPVDDDTVDTIAAAWWLGQVAADLARDPSLATRRPWIEDNITVPLGLLQHW
jgi:hypothetical protein